MWRNLVFMLGALALFAKTVKDTPARPYEVPEAYEVYAAVLALDRAEGELLIADTTVPFQDCLQPRSDKLADRVIKDYKKTNHVRWQLQRNFDLKQNYKLLSQDEIQGHEKPDPKGGFFWSFLTTLKSGAFPQLDLTRIRPWRL